MDPISRDERTRLPAIHATPDFSPSPVPAGSPPRIRACAKPIGAPSSGQRARAATGLHVVLASVESTARRHESLFQRARTTEAAFKPFESATTLLDALATASELEAGARQALVRALVRQHQGAPHPLWQALLLRAFEPMLLRLRRRDRGSKDDRDQRVLLAFLQAITQLAPSAGPVFIALARATARELFRAVRSESAYAGDEPFDDGSLAGLPSPHADWQPFVACLAREAVGLLRDCPDGEDLARMLAGVESVAEQATRLGTPPSTYRQRKSRALGELRAELEGR